MSAGAAARRKAVKRKWDIRNRKHIYEYNRRRRFEDPARINRTANSWYRHNKGRRKATIRANQIVVAAIARSIVDKARGKKCHDCREQHPPWRMEFDHCRGKKLGTINKFMYSLSALRREMIKCDVVCANCHKDRTHKRRLRDKRRKQCR